MIDIMNISHKTDMNIVEFIDEVTITVEAMAWCRQATVRYPNQCCPDYLTLYGDTKCRWVDIFRKLIARSTLVPAYHDDVIKWNHFPRNWPFVRGIHRSPVDSPHKGQWHGALMFSLICAWIDGWANNRDAGDLRRHRAHYDVTVISWRHESEAFWHCYRLTLLKRINIEIYVAVVVE